jgi:hypothetical protein
MVNLKGSEEGNIHGLIEILSWYLPGETDEQREKP